MFDDLKKNATLLRILLILLIIAVGVYVIGILWQIIGIFSDIIIVLVMAWLLSFIIEPVVDTISEVGHVSKSWATTLTYILILLLFIGIVFLFIPTVTQQIKVLTVIIPDFLKTAPPYIERFAANITNSINQSVAFIPSVAQFFFSLFVMLILSFYFTVDKDHMNKEFFELMPDEWHERVKFMQELINSTFASFLRVQLTFGILSGVITWIIFTLLGLEFAASTSLLSGILATVPLIGPVLAIIPPVFVALLADSTKALIVFGVLLIAQQIIFNIVGPRLLGSAFRIHPAIVIISFLVGTKLAGGVGAIFAVPILGISSVVLRKLGKRFFHPQKK
jgi:predicted PurR-regulated permease PerM